MKRYLNQFLIALVVLGNPAVIMPMEMRRAHFLHIERLNHRNQPAPAQCALCFSAPGDVEFRQLTCGHNEVCVECLRDQLNPVLDAADLQEPMRAQLRCPNQACRQVAGDRHAIPPLMQPGDIRLIYDGDQARVDRFNEVVRILNIRQETLQNEAAFNAFLAQNPNARRCPTEGCQWAYMLGNGQVPANVQCDVCRQQYCSHCRAQHPVGDRCRRPQEMGNNNNAPAQISAAERANREWARRNIKRCPSCQRNTHKYTGCNHMTCYQRDPYTQEFIGGCGFQFCWIDLRPWNHGVGHHDHQFGEYPRLEVHNNEADPDLEEARRNPPLPPRAFRRGPNYTPIFVIGGVAVAGAASYAAYKLYKYFTASKPVPEVDLKTSLENLHKEAIKARLRAMGPLGYIPGMFKNYFVEQASLKAYKQLDAVKMVQLAKIVHDFELGLVAGESDKQYGALVNFIIALDEKPVEVVVQKPVEVKPVVHVKPVVADQPHVKQTPAKSKPASKRPGSRGKRISITS